MSINQTTKTLNFQDLISEKDNLEQQQIIFDDKNELTLQVRESIDANNNPALKAHKSNLKIKSTHSLAKVKDQNNLQTGRSKKSKYTYTQNNHTINNDEKAEKHNEDENKENINSRILNSINDKVNSKLPRFLFISKEDLFHLDHKLINDINQLKDYYERKIDFLSNERDELKRKVKMEHSLSQFVYNFDLINSKLCNEIDKIKENHKLEMMIEKDKFERRMHELKNLIFQKIILHRDETRQLIINGTSNREAIDKLQIKALVDELIYASDAYEALYSKNLEISSQLMLKDAMNEELKAANEFSMLEIQKLISLLRKIKGTIEYYKTDSPVKSSLKNSNITLHQNPNKHQNSLINENLPQLEGNPNIKSYKDLSKLINSQIEKSGVMNQKIIKIVQEIEQKKKEEKDKKKLKNKKFKAAYFKEEHKRTPMKKVMKKNANITNTNIVSSQISTTNFNTSVFNNTNSTGFPNTLYHNFNNTYNTNNKEKKNSDHLLISDLNELSEGDEDNKINNIKFSGYQIKSTKSQNIRKKSELSQEISLNKQCRTSQDFHVSNASHKNSLFSDSNFHGFVGKLSSSNGPKQNLPAGLSFLNYKSKFKNLLRTQGRWRLNDSSYINTQADCPTSLRNGKNGFNKSLSNFGGKRLLVPYSIINKTSDRNKQYKIANKASVLDFLIGKG